MVFRKKNKLPTSNIFMSNGLHAQIVELKTTDYLDGVQTGFTH